MLGPGVRDDQGSRPEGRRAAQHVEADAAGSAMVPRRQPAPVTALFAVPCAAAQGANGRCANSGLRAAGGASQELSGSDADNSTQFRNLSSTIRSHRTLTRTT